MTIRSILFAASAAVVLFGSAARAEEGEGHKGHMAAFKAACGADVDKFCKDAEKGKATFECLKTHETELSDTCKTFRAEHHHPHGDGQPAKE